jgi:hypothetical protein
MDGTNIHEDEDVGNQSQAPANSQHNSLNSATVVTAVKKEEFA